MACLEVKRDVNYNPHRGKNRIVVLRNHEDRTLNKSQRFAPVLSYSFLRILTSKATNKGCILQQGDFKNTFCNALLQDDDIAIVRPPLGDTDSVPSNF